LLLAPPPLPGRKHHSPSFASHRQFIDAFPPEVKLTTLFAAKALPYRKRAIPGKPFFEIEVRLSEAFPPEQIDGGEEPSTEHLIQYLL